MTGPLAGVEEVREVVETGVPLGELEELEEPPGAEPPDVPWGWPAELEVPAAAEPPVVAPAWDVLEDVALVVEGAVVAEVLARVVPEVSGEPVEPPVVGTSVPPRVTPAPEDEECRAGLAARW